MNSRTHWLRRAIQALVSAGLVAWVIRQITWTDLWAAIGGASPLIVGVVGVLYYLSILLSCWKWQILLRLEQIDLGLPQLLRWYLIGAFASNFLPTDIGGDFGRGLLAGRASGQPIATARSIIAERFSGLIMMLALAWIGLIVLIGQYALAAGLLGLAMLAWAALAAQPHIRAPLAVSSRLGQLAVRVPARLRSALRDSAVAWCRYRSDRRALGMVLAISLIFQLLAGIGYWLNMRAVGLALPLPAVILATAIVGVAGILPISVNGWGLRESLLIGLLAPFGAASASLVAGALLGRALQLLLSLPGAALLLREQAAEYRPTYDVRSHPPRAEKDLD